MGGQVALGAEVVPLAGELGHVEAFQRVTSAGGEGVVARGDPAARIEAGGAADGGPMRALFSARGGGTFGAGGVEPLPRGGRRTVRGVTAV